MRCPLFTRLLLPILLPACTASAQPGDLLSVHFAGRFGQVEVGGPYAGVEFHGSRPLPSRISFYAPVANSIDVSTDYWKRGESRPMAAALRVNGGAPVELGKEGWAYTLSPHRVRFDETVSGIACTMTYEFCEDAPAMVYRLVFTNTTGASVALEAYTHLRITLRSCQTYARFDSARTEYDAGAGAALFRFDDRALGQAVCFVQNAGLRPSGWTTSGEELGIDDHGGSHWLRSPAELGKREFRGPGKGITVAAFVYRATLAPGDSIAIVQIIGSGDASRVANVIQKLPRTWRKEVGRYDLRVERLALSGTRFSSGDPSLDRSAAWARGILAANAHYIDGRIVPMPCPAEYNFFFTHDLLLTDLAAVQWDTGRVRRDLRFVAALAKDSIIPHAYYWRDSAFVTEYCTPDNWNHLWFVIATGSYLRHSGDGATARTLFPLVTKSISEVLRQRREDNLMYGYRPDWWDIGHVDGARAYLTILTIRALREYVALNVHLARSSTGVPARGSYLLELETIADSMQQALQTQLWNPRREYLMERIGREEDPHVFMGPVVAAVYGLLDDVHARRLVATAERELVDPRLGVRTVAPADFQTTDAIASYRLVGNEAGQPYYYINGGIWPHANAWYVMALARLGRANDALNFLRRTMSLDGVMASPCGHPAMFEYRCADTASSEYGTIDKPSFLWAGGFYLYALYRLFGVDEDEWNISLGGTAVPIDDSIGTDRGSGTGVPARGSSRIHPEVRFPLAFGTVKDVKLPGSATGARSLIADGKALHSIVLPMSARRARSLKAAPKPSRTPVVLAANTILEDVHAGPAAKTLSMDLSSFPGHAVVVKVAMRTPPARVTVAGKPVEWLAGPHAESGWNTITVRCRSTTGRDTLSIAY
jgi:hypothetical protein